jgi:hypothetical protein
MFNYLFQADGKLTGYKYKKNEIFGTYFLCNHTFSKLQYGGSSNEK